MRSHWPTSWGDCGQPATTSEAPDPIWTAEGLLDRILGGARNVGGYAPGELAAMLGEGGASRVWLGDYGRWLDEGYVPALRDKVIADWGDPADATLMASGGSLIIPALRFGNVAVLPQPARGWGEDAEKLYHADDLAPHHQYVATYSWLRAEEPVGFGADAVIHLGTHGTLEWLDGKDMGLSAADAPDALIADLPNLYVYNVDVVGEGLVARRRGMATLVDHMVPPFVESELLPDLAALSESVDDYHEAVHKNEQLAAAYADQLRQQATDLGMVKDLELDLGTGAEIDHDALHAIEAYLLELQGQTIPYGLHAFGRTPTPEMRASTVEAIVSVDRSLLPEGVAVMAADMERRIVESGPRELDRLLRALDGGYVPAGGGGEADPQPGCLSHRQELLRDRSGQGPEAGRVAARRGPRRPHAGGSRGRARTLPGEGVVRHLGHGDAAARGSAGIADLPPPRHAPGMGCAREGGRRGGGSRARARPPARRLRDRLGRGGDVQQRHPADGRGGAAREGAGGGREPRPPALPGDEGRAGRAGLLGGGCGSARRSADLRRAARGRST